MARPITSPTGRPREKFSTTLDADLLDWLKAQVAKGTYASVAHGLDAGIRVLQREEGAPSRGSRSSTSKK